MAATPATVFVVFTSLLFLLHGTATVVGASEEDDRSALLAFKSAVSGDPNGALAGWGASLDACNWTGVACDKVARRVVRLELIDQKLSGEVSPALGYLSHLRMLNLSGNLFAGTVPPELGNLSRLKVLDLSSNTLLAGTVPPELGNLSRLRSLDLSGNAFAGPVPLVLGKLSRLKLLNLADNGFQGSIPLELTRVQSLEYLNLGGNNLSGHIPAAIFCNLSAMHYIDLSSNNLHGAIPIGPDCFLPNLTFLVLWSNNLVGGIPRSLSNATKLRWLLLESNHLDGELPSDGRFGGMKNLEILDLSSNYFRSPRNNTDLEPFFASLTSCTGLRELVVARNDLGGTIPPAVSRLSPGLTQLHLEFNRIFGPIPANLSDLANLTTLNLSHNLLNGSIPPDLSRMQRLERLRLSDNLLSGNIPPSLGAIQRLGLVDFSENQLTGAIPDKLTDLKQLSELALHHNQLAGAIPPSIRQCVNLLKLDLSHNMLRGEIPAGLSELSGLQYLNLSGNLLSGAIPATIGEMRMLQGLNLSSNRLSGTIPPELGNCVALEYLDVSANALGGGLPVTVGWLQLLQVLDVSRNGLTGGLPPSLGKMASLRRVNFSYNGFSGEVPSGGAFAGFPADAFLGDARLCAGTASMAHVLARCGSLKRKRRVLHDRRVVVPVAVTVASFTVAIIGLAACRTVARAASVGRDGRRSTMLAYGGGEPSDRGGHPRISHRELSEATGGFEQSSLIGAGRFGRVYEGTLRDGTRVAVKVLDPKTGGGEVSWSFKRECDVLRRTRHRNLVRVVTTCSQPDFHALVLPLMINGSLENRLYPRDGVARRGIDLARLVTIAGNVAEGLAYLHHYAPVRVVHCDLKPSNVLLDDDMMAVVADFGIARVVKDVDHDDDHITGSADPCNSITGLLQGSVGYIAPEYGLGGRPSTEGDVYSFGVMLLELITGKRPTDVLFQEGLTLYDWVRRQRHHPHDITAMVAQSWLADAMFLAIQAEDIVVQLLDLGIACTQHSPLLRPTMVEVCHEVALLKEDLAKHGGVAASVVMTASEESCFTTDSSF